MTMQEREKEEEEEEHEEEEAIEKDSRGWRCVRMQVLDNGCGDARCTCGDGEESACSCDVGVWRAW